VSGGRAAACALAVVVTGSTRLRTTPGARAGSGSRPLRRRSRAWHCQVRRHPLTIPPRRSHRQRGRRRRAYPLGGAGQPPSAFGRADCGIPEPVRCARRTRRSHTRRARRVGQHRDACLLGEPQAPWGLVMLTAGATVRLVLVIEPGLDYTGITTSMGPGAACSSRPARGLIRRTVPPFKRGMQTSRVLWEYRKRQRLMPAHEERRASIREVERKAKPARSRRRG
jgi:hypothetical protein